MKINKFGCQFVLHFAAFITSGLLIGPTAFANGKYNISPGDVISLSISGGLNQNIKIIVGTDGSISVPMIGDIIISNLTLQEARSKVQSLLASKEVHRQTDDGKQYIGLLSPDDINLSIVEYRPVYLMGDVAKPGDQTYRPGLSVGQAISLAGGFDILRYKLDNPFLQLSDLTSEYKSLWVQYTAVEALIARLRAEIEGNQDVDLKPVAVAPVAPSLSAAITVGERQQLSIRNQDFEKEQAYVKDASAKEAQRATTLSEQQAKEMEGVEADAADLRRYKDLYQKGAVAIPGLSEARRMLLLSSTRSLETTALLASVEREKGDLERRLTRLGDARRLQLVHDAEEATVQEAQITAKLQAVSEKLRYTGMVKSQLVRGLDSEPEVTIMRTNNELHTKIVGSVDTELQPGDLIQITLHSFEPSSLSH